MIHHLDIGVDFDFHAYGLSCHVRDYRMAWMINRKLDLDLGYDEHLEALYKGNTSLHSLFTTSLDEERIHLSLIRNSSEKGYFIPEMPQMDFILKIEGAEQTEREEVISAIRSLPQVLMVLELQPEKLKSGMNLIF